MLNIMTDGLSVLSIYKEAVIAFFITVFGIGFFSTGIIVNHKVDVRIRILASFSVGSVVLCLISFVFIILFHFWGLPLRFGGYAILIFAIFVLLKGFWSGEFKKAYTVHAFAMAIALFFLLLARLAFLKHILLPPYSDSPIHYQIVFGFLHPEAGSISKLSLQTILSSYYHFGFHSLVTWLTAITEIEPVMMISLVGQLFLVIGPISMSFLVYTLTHDGNGSLFAGLLAAVGWLMPAFAVNWGKYPAISSLAVIPAVAALVYLSFSNHKRSIDTYIWIGMLVVGAALLHTRALVSLVLLTGCYYIANKLSTGDSYGWFQSIRYAGLYFLLLWSLKAYLVEYYGGGTLAVMLCLLLPFAFRKHSKVSLCIFLFTFGIWLLTDFPLLFNQEYRGLFDRQYVEIMLYIPFSLFGGLGISGFLRSYSVTGNLQWLLLLSLSGIILWNYSRHPMIFPDPCCDYFKEDDQYAFSWLQKHAHKDDLVLISAFDNNGQVLGTDAGIWIWPLLGIGTNKLYFDANWAQRSEVAGLCADPLKNIYVYVGGRPFSFDAELLSQSGDYQEVYQKGQVAILGLSTCTE